MTDASKAVVAIVGAGAKGTGIAEAMLRAGRQIILFDIDREAALKAARAVLTTMQRDAAAGTLNGARLAQAREALRIAKAPADLADAHVVIEAVAENLDLKRKVLAGVEDWISSGTALTTNTGWLCVNAVGSQLRHRERFCGFHFLTPASTPVVEIIPALTTSEGTIEALQALAAGIGHRPVLSADLPGFLVAHLNRGLMGEAARLLEADVAAPHVIDAILRDALGLAHGPFELYDMLGIDVVAKAARHISEGWGGEPRFRDVPLLATRAAAGFTGNGGQRGFLDQAPGTSRSLARDTPIPWDGPVYVSPRMPDLADAIRAMLPNARLVAQPTGKSLNIVTPLGTDAIGDIVEQGLDPVRSVGVDALLLDRVVPVAYTPATSTEIRRAAAGLFAGAGREVAVVRDTPGQIAQRVAAMIVAVGYAMLDKGVASAADIDTAATVALGYRQGPFALSRRIGPKRVVAILTSLQTITGDARWRVPTNLRHVALLAGAQAT